MLTDRADFVWVWNCMAHGMVTARLRHGYGTITARSLHGYGTVTARLEARLRHGADKAPTRLVFNILLVAGSIKLIPHDNNEANSSGVPSYFKILSFSGNISTPTTGPIYPSHPRSMSGVQLWWCSQLGVGDVVTGHSKWLGAFWKQNTYHLAKFYRRKTGDPAEKTFSGIVFT